MPMVLKACIDFCEIEKGKEVHGFAVKVGFGRDLYLGNTLLSFYSRCGGVESARKVFEEMPERNVVSWASMIGAVSAHGSFEEAVGLYINMKVHGGLLPDRVIVVSVLPACGELKDEVMARVIHGYVVKVGLICQVSISTAFVDLYGKCGNVKNSLQVFHEMEDKDAVSWSAMISSFARIVSESSVLRGYDVAGVDDVFYLYNCMIRSGVRPDERTLRSFLKVCADFYAVEKGKEVHGFAVKVGFDRDVIWGNTLLLFYRRCGCFQSARKVFEDMPEKCDVSWNTMITAVSAHGNFEEAVGLYINMKVQGGLLPDAYSVVSVLPACVELKDEVLARVIHGYVVKVGLICQVRVGNAFIDVYGKCGNVKCSLQVFDEMQEKDIVSWNTIISSFAHTKSYDDALSMLRLMIDAKVNLDAVSILNMLPVIVELEYFDAGKEIHGVIIRKGLDSDLFILNSLIGMYSKSGHLAKASSIFDKMSERNAETWNTMVANFARNNNEVAAIELVREMQSLGKTPDSVTFANLLPACARICALTSGKEIHARCIRNGNSFDITVSNALIDMYVKCGALNLAQNVFDLSPRDEVSCNTLIAGYSQSVDCLKSLNLFQEMGLLGLEQDAVSFEGAIAACANSISN